MCVRSLLAQYKTKKSIHCTLCCRLQYQPRSQYSLYYVVNCKFALCCQQFITTFNSIMFQTFADNSRRVKSYFPTYFDLHANWIWLSEGGPCTKSRSSCREFGHLQPQDYHNTSSLPLIAIPSLLTYLSWSPEWIEPLCCWVTDIPWLELSTGSEKIVGILLRELDYCSHGNAPQWWYCSPKSSWDSNLCNTDTPPQVRVSGSPGQANHCDRYRKGSYVSRLLHVPGVACLTGCGFVSRGVRGCEFCIARKASRLYSYRQVL